MQPIAFTGYTSSNPFVTAQQAQQDFEMRKALAAQQLQTGGIDAQTKSNIYATQVLSAATATGDQNQYDNAKKQLATQGVDVSTWAPDVQSGAQQAQAARLAQSPLGSLLNAGLKAESNTIAGTQAMGNTTAGSAVSPLSTAILGGNLGIPGLSAVPGVRPTAQPVAAPRPATPPPTDPTDAQFNALFPPQPDNSAPAQPVVLTPPSATAAPTANSVAAFSPPPQQPGETMAAYNSRVQQAFEAYKSDPNYLTASAKATETGKGQADASKAAIGAGANYDQVVQTLNGIKGLINSPAGLPQDRGFIPASMKASLAQNLGDTAIGNALGVPPQEQADNANAFTKLNEAQTIGAIKELASTGQIRMTRTLENILNRGYLIEPGASPKSKNQQADLILAELNNSKIAAQNVNAGMNGGQAAPYQAMPVQTGAPVDTSGIKFLGFK